MLIASSTTVPVCLKPKCGRTISEALGGPLTIPGLDDGKQKTFFFYSGEILRLRSPQQATITSVPTLELRNSLAPVELRGILQSFPLPTPGYAQEAGHTAPFVASYSQPSSIDSHGVRVDHSFTDQFRVFGRVAFVPSSTASRSSSNLAQITDSEVNNKALTLGATTSSALARERRRVQYHLDGSVNQGSHR